MFKARMKFAKEGRAKYISHLDLMHAMQRSMARCQMPLWFTEGFNQHAYVSVALPLRPVTPASANFWISISRQKPCRKMRWKRSMMYFRGPACNRDLPACRRRHEGRFN